MQQSGLQAVFMENRPALQRFLRARGASIEADDILQDMWLKLGKIEPGPIAEPVSYLYRMADNHLLDRHRASGRRARREESWSAVAIVEAGSAENALIARERLAIAEQALASLGERTHAILLRYRVDGVSQKQIASELGVSLSLVEKHLQRAYRALVDVRRRFHAEWLDQHDRALTDTADADR
jgi:RNA polymerase sigma-70 factor (ECF subfamily)